MEEDITPLGRAEKLIDCGELNEAQSILDGVEEHDARLHFLQGKLFLKKNWHNEARKQFEIAIDLDPGNEEYKDAYGQLKKVSEGEKLHDVKKQSKFDGYAECCCMGFCELWGAGLCDLLCNGCS